MADKAPFLRITTRGGETYDHDGYKTFMRQLADEEFRDKYQGVTLTVARSGKPFMHVTLIAPTE